MVQNEIRTCFVIENQNKMYSPRQYKAVCFVSHLKDAMYYWDKSSAQKAVDHIHNPLNHKLCIKEASYDMSNGVVF